MNNVNNLKTKVIVFTGAGASAGLGMPTTTQFIELLKEPWPQLDNFLKYCDTYLEDLDYPKKYSAQMDAEVLRDLLLAVEQSTRNLKNMIEHPPFDARIHVNYSGADSLFTKILREFDTIVRKKYGEVEPRNVYTHYAPFLEVLSRNGMSLVPFFTTNYDLSLESLGDYPDLRWHIETGMEKRGTRTTLNEKRLVKTSVTSPTILLFKMHGSTDWWRNTRTGYIEHISYGVSPGQDYKELLIYPTRIKFNEVSEKPFSFCYDMLKDYLSSEELRLCIVIGYSFRDIKINELFGPALETGLRLLVLDTEVTNIKRQLDVEFPSIMAHDQDRIRIEQIDFGKWGDKGRARLADILNSELKFA